MPVTTPGDFAWNRTPNPQPVPGAKFVRHSEFAALTAKPRVTESPVNVRVASPVFVAGAKVDLAHVDSERGEVHLRPFLRESEWNDSGV